MNWATLEYEWLDWDGNLIGHYSNGEDHMIKKKGGVSAMSPDIARRLVASLKYDVINGSKDERAIFASQVREAIAYIDAQAAQIEALKEKLLEANAELMFLNGACPGGADGCDGLPKWEDLYEYIHNKMFESKEYYRNEAKELLKAEMPEVFD